MRAYGFAGARGRARLWDLSYAADAGVPWARVCRLVRVYGMMEGRMTRSKGDTMSKRGRKRKSRANSGANHGKRPNA